MSLRLYAAAALSLLAGALVPTTMSGAAGASPHPGGKGPVCRIATDEDLRANGVITEQGWYQHEAWEAAPAGQRAIDLVNRTLEKEFRVADLGADAALDRGLVGVALDQHRRTVVVVVDRTLVDERALQRRLRAAVAALPQPIAVRVGPSCHVAHRLADARKLLRARNWHPDVKRASYAVALNAYDSTYHVSFGPADKAVADALAKKLGKRVTIGTQAFQRADRMDDASPHYGGAAIGRYLTSPSCTAGFTLVWSNGARGAATAGHCFNNGESVYSGSWLYGTSGGKSGYPNYDMMWVSDPYQSYANAIYVDPCCPDTRTVTSKGDPSVNNTLCASGMVTKAVCGLTVTSTSAYGCSPDGCTYNLIQAERPGSVIVAHGDSGAPLYSRPTTTTAKINGMVIGMAGSNSSILYAEPVSIIESHLGATVATS